MARMQLQRSMPVALVAISLAWIGHSLYRATKEPGRETVVVQWSDLIAAAPDTRLDAVVAVSGYVDLRIDGAPFPVLTTRGLGGLTRTTKHPALVLEASHWDSLESDRQIQYDLCGTISVGDRTLHVITYSGGSVWCF